MGKRAVSSEAGVLERIERAFGWGSLSRAGRSSGLALGTGDDAALLVPSPGHEVILTCDWFLEETHFRRDKDPADAVGWKCLARAVSDIAAMGGVPRCFLLSLAMPKELAGRWMDGFLGGLKRAATRFGCELAGGDTTARREMLINIMVVGEVRTGQALRRSGARVGDIIYVSGRLGEAEAGLKLLREGAKKLNARDPRLRKHLYPEPRLALGQWLSGRGCATAAMDLSDGLSSDLARLSAASGVGALVHAGKLPLARSEEINRTRDDRLQAALHGGDDYELLFTVAKKTALVLPKTLAGVTITPIGDITHGNEVLIENRGEKNRLAAGGWDPFKF